MLTHSYLGVFWFYVSSIAATAIKFINQKASDMGVWSLLNLKRLPILIPDLTAMFNVAVGQNPEIPFFNLFLMLLWVPKKGSDDEFVLRGCFCFIIFRLFVWKHFSKKILTQKCINSNGLKKVCWWSFCIKRSHVSQFCFLRASTNVKLSLITNWFFVRVSRGGINFFCYVIRGSSNCGQNRLK